MDLGKILRKFRSDVLEEAANVARNWFRLHCPGECDPDDNHGTMIAEDILRLKAKEPE